MHVLIFYSYKCYWLLKFIISLWGGGGEGSLQLIKSLFIIFHFITYPISVRPTFAKIFQEYLLPCHISFINQKSA